LPCMPTSCVCRVGQNHTVIRCIRYTINLAGNHHGVYGAATPCTRNGQPCHACQQVVCVRLARTIQLYGVYSIRYFWQDITRYTVIYGAYIRFGQPCVYGAATQTAPPPFFLPERLSVSIVLGCNLSVSVVLRCSRIVPHTIFCL